jgi:hypothetical protein
LSDMEKYTNCSDWCKFQVIESACNIYTHFVEDEDKKSEFDWAILR